MCKKSWPGVESISFLQILMNDSLNTTEIVDLIQTHLINASCSKSSTLSFIKGFILGQLSVIVVVILVLRYLFTEDVKHVKKVIWTVKKKELKLILTSDIYLHVLRWIQRPLLQLPHYPTTTSPWKPIMMSFTIHPKVPTGSMCCWHKWFYSIDKMRVSTIGWVVLWIVCLTVVFGQAL